MLNAAGTHSRRRRMARSTANYMAAKRALQEGLHGTSLSYLRHSLLEGPARRRSIALSLLAIIDGAAAGRLLSVESVRARVFWDYA